MAETPFEHAAASDWDRPSRAQIKAELGRIKDFCWVLVELPAGKLSKLDLPDDVRAVVNEARRLTSPPALNRQVQVIKQYLQELDWKAMRRDLEEVEHGRKIVAKPVKPQNDAHRALAGALLDGGDEALFALTERYEREGLQTLRQVLRQERKGLEKGRTRDAALTAIALAVGALRSTV